MTFAILNLKAVILNLNLLWTKGLTITHTAKMLAYLRGL